MLLVGIPLYICASASTPIAAALVLKGISPGAALVFLLAGPATNAATVTIVGRFWGRKATVIYLSCIALCSLILGWLVNRLYSLAELDITRWVEQVGDHAVSPLYTASAVILLLLIGLSFVPGRSKPTDCGCE